MLSDLKQRISANLGTEKNEANNPKQEPNPAPTDETGLCIGKTILPRFCYRTRRRLSPRSDARPRANGVNDIGCGPKIRVHPRRQDLGAPRRSRGPHRRGSRAVSKHPGCGRHLDLAGLRGDRRLQGALQRALRERPDRHTPGHPRRIPRGCRGRRCPQRSPRHRR